ncbi:Ig-like domain-containing protein [Tolumonas lignilytica]|jgi:Bacterial Ig-like domain (group 1).|uniref:Ig-like domain-containing protein n=1 Tax=Tolumonas lignilytica TaxID=1283284 RepID=UPI0004643D37|nr:Ig-like domain-containing protein [Tolumonas lignilytica]
MNYCKNVFALLVAGSLLTACGGGGTDISGGSSGSSTGSSGSSSSSGSSGSTTTATTAYVLSVETCSNSTATACNGITELSLQNTNYVVARLVNSSGQPVSGKVVTLTTDRGTIKPSSGKITDTNGYAVFSLTSTSLSDAGELSNIIASNTSATSITDSIPYGSNANLAFTFSSDVSTLAQGATAALSFTATLNNQPYKTPVTINLTSACLSAGKAVMPTSVTTDSNGIASATYKGVSADGSLACSGADVIEATLASDNTNQHQLTITNQLAPSSTIIAATPSPEFITLHGYNGASSRITFTVKNSEGTAVPAQTVNLSFALPNITSNGYSLSPTTAQTDSNGQVTVTVNAGSIPVPVAVKASLPNTNIQTVSLPIAVGTGYPDSDSFSFSADVYSIEGRSYDGATAKITMRLADRFNNPIPDGTKVYFTTEGGSIQGDLTDAAIGSTPDCITVNSSCTATLTSMNPRPSDGRVTVLAYTEGEESFEDQNGNGILDADDYVNGVLLFDDSKSPGYINTIYYVNNSGVSHGDSEPYLDVNYNGKYDAGEPFVNLNTNSTWDDADGIYHGLACDDTLVSTGACVRQTVQLYHNAEFIFSSIADGSHIYLEQWDANNNKWVSTTGPLDVSVTGYYRFLPVNIAADNTTYNPLPSGAQISVTTTNGGEIAGEIPAAYAGLLSQESTRYINHSQDINVSPLSDLKGKIDSSATRPYYIYFSVKPETTPNNKTTGTLTISATTAAGSSTGAGGSISQPFTANDKS